MIQADQSIERRTDLMTHIGEKFFLRFCFLRRPNGLDLIPHHRQQHTDYDHNTCSQHSHTHPDKYPALFRKDLFVDRHDKVQIHIRFKGHKIKQFFCVFSHMGMIKAKSLHIPKLLFYFFIGQL